MPSVRPTPAAPSGTLRRFEHSSRVLAGNPWNDPVDRPLSVYLPHGYDESDAAYPALWGLAAFTNSGPGHLNWRNHGENLPQRLDRLIAEGAMPPVVVVFPDCYTSLGGNQYVNSPSVGRYADYLVEELIPFVAERVHVVAGRDGRGLFGKSSGGYGALYHAMNYSEFWGAAASHAGDAGFDLLFRPAFPDTSVALARHGGDALKFMRAFWSAKQLSGRDFNALMILAMAASYDPDPDHPATIRLPFDLHTCELDAERWGHWLRFDPIHMAARAADSLKSLHALYLDVGSRDQYHIQYGTRVLVRRLGELGVDCRFEEFDGTHSGIDWRLDHSLPYLAAALKSASDAAT
ncbi:alpha/beta hydrolase [Elongatibacter sediminis]|uniref:Alpha/beta hydrolase-fold protein n=1 Tax=Elongatibacter sediminis TaxID=3119006 RepID=A0AAW9RGC2_9GAMM